MVHFFELPPEIINYILQDLSPKDIVQCQATSGFLNNTIRDSAVLQHKLALTRVSADDSPLSNDLLVDKVKALNRIEDAWISLRSDFSREISVPLRQSGVYDLSAGVYLLSHADRMSLGYIRLPSNKDDEVTWNVVEVKNMIVDIGLCVYEHDLIAIITSTPRADTGTHDIHLEFVELSTKKKHPLAQKTPLFVMVSDIPKPSVGIEIVGKVLVLIFAFNAPNHAQDRIFIIDWQTGTTLASFEARSHTYAGLIFLDENHILLPNTRNNSLDIFRIPDAPTLAILKPILILSLPRLNEGRIIGFATCRAEPNPIAEESYPAMRERASRRPKNAGVDLNPSRGFLLKSDSALCMFELRIHILQFMLVPGAGLQMNFPFRHAFNFVVQRSALLHLVDTHGQKADTASSTAPAPAEDFSVPPPPDAEPPIPTMKYADWGPNITAWFARNENDISTFWITTSAGRRCVRMPVEDVEDGTSDGHRFYICEFGSVKQENIPHEDEWDEPLDKGKGKADEESSSDDDVVYHNAEEEFDDEEIPRDKGKGKAKAEDLEDTEDDGPDRDISSSVGSDTDNAEIHHWLDILRSPESPVNDSALENDLPFILAEQQSEDPENDEQTSDFESDAEAPETLADFLADPHRVTRTDPGETWATDPLPGPDEDVCVVGSGRVLNCPEVFAESINHNLPYVVRASHDKYRWQGVLLDEERVIGISATDHFVDSIDVLHFG